MNLYDALKAIAPAVGDGKIVQAHAFVLLQYRVLYAADGRQFANIAPIDCAASLRFCVRHDALMRAMSAGPAELTPFDASGVAVVRGRSRVRLRGIPDMVPVPTSGEASITIGLPTNFHTVLGDLIPFMGEADGQIWTRGVHLTPDFVFAANNYAAIRRKVSINYLRNVSLPFWAVQLIAGRDSAPATMTDYGNLIQFAWADGLTLFTTLLAQEAPEQVVTLVSNMADVSDLVPDGLKEAVERIKGYGATTAVIGNGLVSHRSMLVEVDEEVDVPNPPRRWGVDHVLKALTLAERLNLRGDHATWQGTGYTGIFSGMSG